MFIRVYFLTAVVALLFITLLSFCALSIDGFAATHLQEDQTVEMAGALIFLAAAVISAVAIFSRAGAVAVFLCVLSAAAFLDEMSFGERHVGFVAPEAHGVKIDGFHDLLSLSWRVVGNRYVYAILAVVFTALILFAAIYMLRNSKRVRAFAMHPVMPLIAVSATLVVIAQFIDYAFGIFVIRTLFGESGLAFLQRSYFEEGAELMAAVLLFVAACQLVIAARARTNAEPDQTSS